MSALLNASCAAWRVHKGHALITGRAARITNTARIHCIDNETGVLETCRWKTIDGVNNYDCLITLSNGESGAIKSFVLDDESHKQVTVKVEVNKLRKKRKRYTFISSI